MHHHPGHHLNGAGILLVLAFGGCGSGAAASADADPQPDGGGADINVNVNDGGTLRRCPTDLPGPEMIRIPRSNKIAFCVDSTEVTNAQYAAFMAAGAPTASQSPRCGWNPSFAPGSSATKKLYGPVCPTFDPAARADYPVVCVGWCDADAYCRWANKRLCQAPQDDGAGRPVVDWTLPGSSEWVIACAGDEPKRFPYGDAPAAGRCVDKQYLAPMPGVRPVKEATTCVGSAEGLFDMSGNASEWTDDCVPVATSADGTGDTCTALGGSSSTEVGLSSCIGGTPFLRNQVAGDTGFRCCADTVSPF